MGKHSDHRVPVTAPAGRAAPTVVAPLIRWGRVPLAVLVTAAVVVAVVLLARPGSTGRGVAAADPATRPSATGAATDVAADTTAGPPGAPQSSPDAFVPAAAAECTVWRIVTAPELATVVRAAVTDLSPCAAAGVVARDPADLVDLVAAGADPQVDIWIPDSSWWLARAQQVGLPAPVSSASIAGSPIVLAVAPSTARTLATPVTLTSVLRSRGAASPVRVGLPDPHRSAVSIGLLVALDAETAGRPDAAAASTWGLRSSPPGLAAAAEQLLTGLTQHPDTAVPVSEQAVLVHNRDAGVDAATPIYPTVGGSMLDYPLAVLDPAAAALATGLRRVLSEPAAVDLLAANGFRGPVGSSAPSNDGALPADPATGYPPLPAGPVVSALLDSVDLSNRPSRLLGLLDVSGSMNAVVPEAAGATRISLATQAAARGVGLYPMDSELGLWVFARTLTASTDYREVVPVAPLGDSVDGITGRQRLTAALGGIRATPDGGTGLYDTTLAAVRQMRAQWDPDRINSVLILSDGKNDDADSITLTDLLATLTAESDPARPVTVISIAFGPDSDVAALAEISAATGGPSYVSHDPRDVGEIFLDSVGHRMCRSSCPGGG